ncbi:MAG: GH3 auxin-responsive promoter family protein [Gemmataceae bacterium]|nr:GH3 auxin-responsive promoter family protein [Gemmataceae bacterium]
MSWILNVALGNRWVRKAVDTSFGWYAGRRARKLDRVSVDDVQKQTLLHLIRQAQSTRFGKEHGFAGIRNVEDFQERVPLRDYEAFWQDYWRRSYPVLENVTWPGRIPYFALSSGTTSGTTKYIPVSRQMMASNRTAALTSLAWFRAAYREAPLLTGRLFFLGGSTDLQKLDDGSILAGDLSGIVTRDAASLMGPFTYPPLDVALLRDWEQKLQRFAEQSVALPITMISGVPSWLLILFDRLRQITGKERIAEIWPDLRLVIHGGTSFEPYRSLFRKLIGNSDVQFLETYPASEGFIAAEDPRFRLLRLISDHGVFFEFVPVEDLGQTRPTRHTVADVVPGIQYAVVLTTCAGLWSYVIGDTVCFECRDPPLLRFTGRTRYFLSAFGEHLISEEIERAIADAAETTGAAVSDFHVGPVFPSSPTGIGRHRYLVEFVQHPRDLARFSRQLDETLCRINEDYAAHRAGDMTMRPPEVTVVHRGGFAAWMKTKGKHGGQHKLPRMDNSGKLTAEISEWLVTAHGPGHPKDSGTLHAQPRGLVGA